METSLQRLPDLICLRMFTRGTGTSLYRQYNRL